MLKSFPTEVVAVEASKTDKTVRSDSFFTLFNNLVALINKNGDAQKSFDLRLVLETVIGRMRSHVSNEVNSVWDNDRTLIGYITIAKELLAIYAESVEY
jgi:hypothetical protein